MSPLGGAAPSSPFPHPHPYPWGSGTAPRPPGEWWQRPFGREEGRRGWGVHPQNHEEPGAVGTLGPWNIHPSSQGQVEFSSEVLSWEEKIWGVHR